LPDPDPIESISAPYAARYEPTAQTLHSYAKPGRFIGQLDFDGRTGGDRTSGGG
jgi:hypothetical protein